MSVVSFQNALYLLGGYVRKGSFGDDTFDSNEAPVDCNEAQADFIAMRLI
jgi:hypothetical protein